MVFALVGDSTMTSAPPFTGAASVSSVSAVGRASSATFFLRGALGFFGLTLFWFSALFNFCSKALGVSAPSRAASLPTRARLRKLGDFRSHGFRTLRLGLDRRVGLGVEWIAFLEQLAHAREWVITHQNGTGSRRLGAARCHFGARF